MLDRDELNGLVRAILATRPDELGCDECLQQLDRFVEIDLAGSDAAGAMPLVRDHLNRCGDCREEFEALLLALRMMDAPAPVRRLNIYARRLLRAMRR